MPQFDMVCEFEVYCAKCGNGICNNCDTMLTRNRGANRLEVQPCTSCLEESHDKGYAEAEKDLTG